MMTVYLHVAFRDFKPLTAEATAALPAAFFAPPAGYVVTKLEDKLDAIEAHMEASGRHGDDEVYRPS